MPVSQARTERRLEALREAAEDARKATERRNTLVCQLRYEDGLSLRVIAEAAGLTHSAIARLAPPP